MNTLTKKELKDLFQCGAFIKAKGMSVLISTQHNVMKAY